MPRTAITLRNLPAEVEKAVRTRSARKKTSANRTVIEMLEEALGLAPNEAKPHLYNDLNDLAGRWCAEEAAAFDAGLRDQRGIDGEHWK